MVSNLEVLLKIMILRKYIGFYTVDLIIPEILLKMKLKAGRKCRLAQILELI